MGYAGNDWSRPHRETAMATIRIGASRRVRATAPDPGGGRSEGTFDVVTHEDAVLTWTGPGEDRKAARLALADARVAWRVAAALCGWPDRELPDALSHAFEPAALGAAVDRSYNTLTLGPVLTGTMAGPRRPVHGDAGLEGVARDALLAAASRTPLPGPGGHVRLDYGQNGRHDRNDPGNDLEVNAAVYDDGWQESHDGVWMSNHAPRGILRIATVALGVAETLAAEDGPGDGPGAALTVPDGQGSHTLAAAFRADVVGRARERANRVAAFLAGVGLEAAGASFAGTYG